MAVSSIAYLGPSGTYSELAAAIYAGWLSCASELQAFSSIRGALQAVAQQRCDRAVVPVENSIGGSVTTTLDTLWEVELQIQQAFVLPIQHALVSCAPSLAAIHRVYSHPQALAQCQRWLEQTLPFAQQVALGSTTAALEQLASQPDTGAIASPRAAQLYGLPVLAHPISDRADNCTRFWVLSRQPSQQGNHTSMAFSLEANTPGALLKPLQLFATQNINMSRIESRPSQRALGDYLFFIDIEASLADPQTQAALQLMETCTDTLKCFGSYEVISASDLATDWRTVP